MSAGDRCLALFAPVAVDYLILEGVDRRVELLPLIGHLGLNLVKPIQGLPDLVVRQIRKLGENTVVHDLVDQPAPGLRGNRRHDLDALEIGFLAKDHSTGEDLGQCLEQGLLLLPATMTQLEIEQIHPSVEQTAVVRNLRLNVLGGVASLSQFLQLEPGQVDCVLILEDDVDAAATVVHAARLLAGSGQGGIGVHRGSAPSAGMELEVDVRAAPRGIATSTVEGNCLSLTHALTAGDVPSG